MGKEEDENKVALDDQSPPLMLKKKNKDALDDQSPSVEENKTKGLQRKPKQTKCEKVGATFGASRNLPCNTNDVVGMSFSSEVGFDRTCFTQ